MPVAEIKHEIPPKDDDVNITDTKNNEIKDLDKGETDKPTIGEQEKENKSESEKENKKVTEADNTNNGEQGKESENVTKVDNTNNSDQEKENEKVVEVDNINVDDKINVDIDNIASNVLQNIVKNDSFFEDLLSLPTMNEDKQEEINAALKIQTQWRGHKAMKNVEKICKEKGVEPPKAVKKHIEKEQKRREEQLSPQEKELLEKAKTKFSEFDADGNGTLGTKNSEELLAVVEWLWTEKQVDESCDSQSVEMKYRAAAKLLKDVDANNDGVMDFNEFRKWYSETCADINSLKKQKEKQSQAISENKKISIPTNSDSVEEIPKKIEVSIIETANVGTDVKTPTLNVNNINKTTKITTGTDVKTPTLDINNINKTKKFTKHTSRTQEELKLLEELENGNNFLNNKYYKNILENSISVKEFNALENNIGSLQDSNEKLQLKLKHAISETEQSKNESKMREKIIDTLKTANSKYLKDRDTASHHLKVKTEAIGSLKRTIKNLKKSLEDMIKEKSEVGSVLRETQINLEAYKSENIKLNKLHELSVNNLKELPEYQDLQKELVQSTQNIQIEKDGRLATLEAWEKAQSQWKEEEEKYERNKSGLLSDIKNLQEDKTEMQRNLNWQQEEVQRFERKIKSLEEDGRRKVEECTQLRIKLGTIETEIKAGSELEKLKSQITLESLTNEMKWRENVFRNKLHTMQRQLDITSMEKLKLQKSLTQLEADLQEERETPPTHNNGIQQQMPMPPPQAMPTNQYRTTRANRKIFMKQRFLELETLDSEIARLKNEISKRPNPSTDALNFKDDFSLPPIRNNNNNQQQFQSPRSDYTTDPRMMHQQQQQQHHMNRVQRPGQVINSPQVQQQQQSGPVMNSPIHRGNNNNNNNLRRPQYQSPETSHRTGNQR